MPIEKREEDGATPKPTRRRSSATSPNVTEAKPPASVAEIRVADVTVADVTTPGITLPVTETPWSAEEEIRRRAYELYEQDGGQHGRDREHWLRAEAEVLSRANEARASDAHWNQGRANERASRRGQKSA
jgi:hypothetical protein